MFAARQASMYAARSKNESGSGSGSSAGCGLIDHQRTQVIQELLRTRRNGGYGKATPTGRMGKFVRVASAGGFGQFAVAARPGGQCAVGLG